MTTQRQRFDVRRYSLILVAVVVTAAIALGARTAHAMPGEDTKVTVRLIADWANFDLQVQEVGMSGFAQYAGYDRLVAMRQLKPGAPPTVVPYLATHWVMRAKSITFQLRKDAKCQDGTPVTPLVVLNSFKRLLTVRKTSAFLPTYFGPGPYHLGANVKKGTFTFRSETPFRNMLVGFAEPGAGIVCPAGLAAVANQSNALEAQMYGSGPYKLVSAAHGDQITFQKNAAWKWGPGGRTAADLPNTLVMRVVVDDTTAANLFLTGGLDIATVLGPDLPRLIADRSLKAVKIPYNQPLVLIYNMAPGRQTTDQALRAALAAAVDPAAIAQGYDGGVSTPTRVLIDGKLDCYSAANAKLAAKTNLTRASQLLTAGGYQLQGDKLMKDGKQVSIVLPESPLYGAAQAYLAGQYRKLGIDVVERGTDHATFVRSLQAGNFDVAMLLSNAPEPGPLTRSALIVGPPTPTGQNFANTALGDRDASTWIRLAQERPGTRGCKYYNQFEKRYLERSYVTPALLATQYWFTKKGIDFWAGGRYPDPGSIKVTG